jgi:catechol 2,3-dioxygenase-like lactoylglutathione lyase family enzyme
LHDAAAPGESSPTGKDEAWARKNWPGIRSTLWGRGCRQSRHFRAEEGVHVTSPLIHHIGILVPDLEAAMDKWGRVLGYSFSPIGRYRTHRYCDHSDPELHFHDARISFSLEGPPHIELMEATGTGTHAAAQLGVHHFGFPGTPDTKARMAELAELGIGADGQSFNADGELLLWFTQKAAMDGVRLEYISPLPGPTVADDGSELWHDPQTGRHNLWGPPDERPPVA